MGVLKLWELLLTIAKPYDIEQLYGKIVAIDASIWIVKIDTIFGSNTEKIKSILSKIMLMKRNNILPIFVFDGVPPALKRKTLEQRSRKRLVANEMQAKKKSQIQIMRMIEGDNSRQSQKNKKLQQNQQQLQEINTRLQRLSAFSNTQQNISKQFLQKITLQSQILNAKYKIMLDLLPQFRKYQNYISLEEYQQLDLQYKTQYLEELEEYKWKHIKKQRKKDRRENMTQQEKLRADLEIIQKKSIIREMQDNLFRKMLQKNMKIENGYQIIQTIYNGKTVIQKRKIKQQNQCSKFGFGGLRKGKSKNDFSKLTFGEEKDSQAQAEIDPFVSSFCNHSAPFKKSAQNTSQSQVTSQIEPKTEETQKAYMLKSKDTTAKQVEKKKKTAKQVEAKKHRQKKTKLDGFSSNNEQSSQPYLPFVNYNERKDQQPEFYVNRQQFNQKSAQSQQQLMNKDNLPNFRSDQHPEYLNSSNDNLQLQNLFKILGLPFLVAPGEAEAQCAALQQQGIVDGIITQDSDIFLFGGKNVFRGLFNNNIRYYSFDIMQQKLKLNREKLIIFAELLGSDYTEGVKGIGLVNAMQILKVFNTFEKLQKFKQWAEHPDVLLPQQQKTDQLLKMASEQQKEFYQLHKRFKNYWYIGQSFGNKSVHNAYLKPDVVKKQQLKKLQEKGQFSQKPLKQQLLSKLLKQRLQLQGKQYDHYFRLLSLKYNNKRENTLLNYFGRIEPKQDVQYARIKSKRLQKSLQSQENND